MKHETGASDIGLQHAGRKKGPSRITLITLSKTELSLTTED
ncbi:MAG: hypothetical protein ABJH85_03935 [Paracoccaceae bacterium]